jgi:acetyl-CoA carboxylase biotin carboxylase subunit
MATPGAGHGPHAHGLAETVVEGINTNIPLHRELMVDAKFMAGGTNIHYLEEWLSQHKR